MTDGTRAHEELLAVIGRALGGETPYEEVEGARADAIHLGTMRRLPAGTSREVLGGAVDAAAGRVAWVEQLTGEPQGGYVPVSIDLHFAWGGQHRGRVEVPTYNPYFGCDVRFMRWYGGTLVVIYREKHRTLAMRLEPPSQALTLAVLEDRWAIDDDTVYFVSQDPGLLEARLLPSLELALPLPALMPPSGKQFWRHAPGTLALAPLPPIATGETRDAYFARLEAERSQAHLVPLPPREARTFVPAPAHFRARMQELLARTVPPPLGVDLLVGAVATPFWKEEQPVRTSYTTGLGRGCSPRYLPVYWYQRLREDGHADAAQQWLHWLERLAVLDDVDPEPWTRADASDEGVVRTALVYLRARARVLAEACRTGRLPKGEYCYLFTTPERTRHLEEDRLRPPGFHEVLRQLVARRPKSISESD
ncbi:hypothetical protein [Pyxidicoccus xibeiensis]|uniref:hypothetical protein n=1 Tax=Pyxidicoccus xibeiensis TaxID=2906759 RepID=UPI0020A75967|nr:hypothetical protein [Pyxidicoccus xibeiensis]MCP3136082.1 hypothetical protein [Pyxidicoccus xibeiensis]